LELQGTSGAPIGLRYGWVERKESAQGAKLKSAEFSGSDAARVRERAQRMGGTGELNIPREVPLTDSIDAAVRGPDEASYVEAAVEREVHAGDSTRGALFDFEGESPLGPLVELEVGVHGDLARKGVDRELEDAGDAREIEVLSVDAELGPISSGA